MPAKPAARPAGEAAFVAGLALALKDVPYAKGPLNTAVNAYIGRMLEKTGTSMLVLMSPLGAMIKHQMPPAAQEAAIQLTMLTQRGTDYMALLVDEAWTVANGAAVPADIEGYSHFGVGLGLETIRKFMGKT